MWQDNNYAPVPTFPPEDSDSKDGECLSSKFLLRVPSEPATSTYQVHCRGKAVRQQERQNSDLLLAVLQSDAEQVKRLLENGAKPQASCRSSMCSTVHLAALRGDDNILRLLLEAGANRDCIDEDGRQPIHLASWSGQISTLDVLLEGHPELIHSQVEIPKDYIRETDLVDSWDHDHEEIRSMLPKISAGSTPLHIACKLSKVQLVKHLLNNGSEVNSRDARGLTPLDVAGLEDTSSSSDQTIPIESKPSHASDRPLYDIISVLIDKGAVLTDKNETIVDGIHLPSIDVTALHTAVANENLELIDFLLENGANLIVLNEQGESPLHLAVRKKLFEPLKTMLSWLELKQINIKNSAGLTPLHQAVQEKWACGVGILLESGADIEVVTEKTKETVLHVAAGIDCPTILEELLSVESSLEIINAKDCQEFTPLFRAIKRNNTTNVEILIKHKADLNVRLPGNFNLLHFAAECETASIMRALLEKDAVRRKLMNELCDNGKGGLSPLHIAAKNGNIELVKILIEKGADVRQTSSRDPHHRSTSLHFAAEKGYWKIIEVILQNTNEKEQVELLNVKTDLDWTPLHIAAGYGHRKSVVLMLKRGANIAEKVMYHGVRKSALDFMVLNIPKCVDVLEELLDTYISCDNSLKYSNCEVKLDYNILLGPTNAKPEEERQMIFLNTVLDNGNSLLKEKIMLHPLVETFLFYKWEKMRNFFMFLFVLYVLHTVLLTSLFVFTYVQKVQVASGWTYATVFVLLLIFAIEVLQALSRKRFYFFDTESWIKWAVVVTSLYTLTLNILDEKRRHYACVAVLLSWAELLFLVARFSLGGLHVLMFEKVAANIFLVLLRFVFIFVGFMFAFMIHFDGQPPFGSFWEAMCKVMSMMTDLDYNNTFKAGADLSVSSLTGRFLYLSYMLLVAMAMANLIVGLAVSDVAVLENQGRAQRLAKQTAFLSFLESCFYNKFVFSCFSCSFQNVVSSLKVASIVSVHPHRPQELPAELRAKVIANATASVQKEDNSIWTETLEEKLDLILAHLKAANNKQ